MSYKIPQNNKYYVSNASDLTPNIQFVRNIDMDKEGYLRLSPPLPNLMDDDRTPDFEFLVDAIHYYTTSQYKIITSGKIYDVDLGGVTVTLDASAPSGNDTSRWSGWKNGYWYMSDGFDLYTWYYVNSPAQQYWKKVNTDSGDYPTVFVNRNTLVQSVSNKVNQYTEADMDETTPPSTNSGTTLTIPGNFVVMGMEYSNYRMGIATRSVTGGSAYFFVWDGATTDASQGFPVYANMILDVVAYKNSWVILTSIGQLLMFNGGGFDVLGNLPPYFTNNENWIIYSNSQEHGKTMYTDGDVIYFNLGSLMESTEDGSGILKGFYSGVWCYDPDMGGIYHRYGLSHSTLIYDVNDAVAGVYTYVAHGLENGDKVRITTNAIKYAVKLTADTYKLAETYDLAIAGTGSATEYNTTKTFIQRTDWAQMVAHSTNTGAVLKFNDGSSFRNESLAPLFAGLGLATKTLTYHNVTSVMAPLFDNIGSVTYAKIKSESLEDVWNSIHVKHGKLTDGDKIIVKYKIKDSYKQVAIGEADDISADVYITWVNATTFTTTKDISAVEVGDEVEFWSGAGAGSTAHIVSSTLVAGTYTVVVDESIRGGVSGNKSTCLFDSFKKLGTITKDTTGNPINQARFSLSKASKWIQIKLELRGNNVVIEETLINNEKQIPIA